MTRPSNSGISQLELMISLIIMGMIAVLLANALNFNRQSLSRSNIISNQTEMLLLQHSLRRWVEGMPLDYSGKTGRWLFEGDKHYLRFRTLVPDGSYQSGELTEFTLTVKTIEEHQSIILQGSGQHPTINTPHTLQIALARNTSSLVISYFGRISSEPEKHWYESWSDEVYLPDLVKIEWEDSKGFPSPPLTLQPGKVERQRYMSLSSLVPPG